MNDTLKMPDTKTFMEINILMDEADTRVLFSCLRGVDLTDDLEKEMKEYGLDCDREFKSPCG